MSSWTAPPEEIVQRMQESTPRPHLVVRAILRILQANLPATLDQLGNVRQAAYPKAYLFAGEALEEPQAPSLWPRIIVSASVTEQEFAMGWQAAVQVSITAAWPGAQVSRREFEESWLIANVCSGILRHPQFQGRFEDPEVPGRILWYQLQPNGYSLVPENWPHYCGWIAHVTAYQSPASDLWQ